MKEAIFRKIEDMIKKVYIEGFNIYNICEKNEKLTLDDNYKNGKTFSYKILKQNILLKYNKMAKVKDYIEIRYLSEDMLKEIKSKFSDANYKNGELYIRINIENIDEIDNLSNEIQKIFKSLFLTYMNTKESFGCCSKYIECSNNKHCVTEDVRARFSCQYKRNLDKGKIFYGANKNI